MQEGRSARQRELQPPVWCILVLKREFKGRRDATKLKNIAVSLPERPATVFLQVVLRSFAVIRGQVKLCRQ